MADRHKACIENHFCQAQKEKISRDGNAVEYKLMDPQNPQFEVLNDPENMSPYCRYVMCYQNKYIIPGKGPYFYYVRKIVGGWVQQKAYNC